MEADFSAILGFFTNDKWSALCDLERRQLWNKHQQYMKLLELGLSPKMPDFMMLTPPPALSNKRPHSVSDDDAWSPSKFVRAARPRKTGSSSRGRSRAPRAARYQPPIKQGAASGSGDTQRAPLPPAKRPARAWYVPPPATETSETETRSRSPSPDEEFHGFTAEDVFNARQLVDTKAERLWIIMTEGFLILGEEPPARLVHKRNRKVVDYTEEEELDDDDYVYCDDCEREWEGESCPNHGPLTVIEDTKVSGRRKRCRPDSGSARTRGCLQGTNARPPTRATAGK